MLLKTYTNLHFLKFLFENVPKISLEDVLLDDKKSFIAWEKITDLLFNKCDLYLNTTPNEFISLSTTNPFIRKIIEAQNGGRIKVNIQQKDFDYGKPIYPSSIYFLEKNITPKNAVFISSFENWSTKIVDLSKHKSIAINSLPHLNDLKNWNFLREISLPINSAVIVDRYILTNKGDLEKNLYSILENLIGCSSAEDKFHLSIITQKNQIFSAEKNLVYNEIKNFLRKKFGDNVEFGLSLVSRNVPHDREILTNYYRIKSPNSFNFFNYDSSISCETILEIAPLNVDDLKSLKNKYIELNNCLKQADTTGLKQNRLFTNLK